MLVADTILSADTQWKIYISAVIICLLLMAPFLVKLFRHKVKLPGTYTPRSMFGYAMLFTFLPGFNVLFAVVLLIKFTLHK